MFLSPGCLSSQSRPPPSLSRPAPPLPHRPQLLPFHPFIQWSCLVLSLVGAVVKPGPCLRPRPLFCFCFQEEQWHETNTFPSISANKDDFVLFLGKRLPPTHPQPSTSTGSPSYHRAGSSSSSSYSSANAAAADSTTTSGDSTLKTYSTADKHLETDFTADRHLGDKPCTAVSEPCTAVSGVNCPGPGVVQTSTAGDGPHDHRGGGARTGSTAGRHATGGEEWDGDTIDEHVEDESDVDEEVDGCGAGVQTISSPDKAGSAAGGSMESGADPAQPRGVGMRKRLSSRLANWRKPKVRVGVYGCLLEEGEAISMRCLALAESWIAKHCFKHPLYDGPRLLALFRDSMAFPQPLKQSQSSEPPSFLLQKLASSVSNPSLILCRLPQKFGYGVVWVHPGHVLR